MPRPRPRRRGLFLPFPLLLLLLALPLAAQERGFQPADSYRLVSVGGVEVAPTGQYIAFQATTVNEEKNRRDQAIWIQELRNGRPVGEPVRFTDPTRSSSSPSWSPDGRVLAFSSRRGEEDGTVWFIRVGPPGGEAYRIEGVRSTPIWSPDGSRIAFVAEPESGDEAADRRARRVAPDAITRALDPKRFDGHVVTHRRYKRDGTFEWVPHPAHQAKDQLFVVAATGGEAVQLTELPYTVRQVEWSPDGSYFVFSADTEEDEEPGPLPITAFDPTGSLWVVASAGGEPREVVALAGRQASPALSPDGRWLAFLHTPAWNAETEVMVVELGRDGTPRGEPRSLTDGWDRTPGPPYWTPDGRSVRWVTTVHAHGHVFEVPARGGAVRPVTTGERSLGSVSVSRDGRVMAYTAEDPSRPGEVFVADAQGRNEVRVTSFNDALAAEVGFQPARRLAWTVADGTDVEGWVIPPFGHQAGQRYPMILNIHGGPHAVYRSSFSPMFQAQSGAGFYVLYVNPRGSTSYGNEFKHAIHAGWGLIDEEDFIDGVQAALREYPDIDPARLGVTGGSYGGYMTNWLTARTDLFAAAVTRASISNWESLAKTTDSNLPHMPFDGASFENREVYRASSPISYVENVRAPTLIIHGEHDFRTPLAEGEQWYQALKKLGVPTEFVLYPRSAHGIREPWLAADNMERTRQWFTHFLQGGAESVPVTVRD
jgi:dipeptidyl aminopeptidase/acylaminoacyl peptidase